MSSPEALLHTTILWHPRLGALGCALVLISMVAWIFFLHHRLKKRFSSNQVKWLLLPKILTLIAFLVALYNPVSAVEKSDVEKNRLLILLDTSSSMGVVDDDHLSRLARSQQIVESWKEALPAETSLDLLNFDTTIHPPAPTTTQDLRGTDLGSCLLSLAERNDTSLYRGAILLTDGGDEPLENPVIPKLPLYIVGIGTDPKGWNDVSILDVKCPPTAEKEINFEISIDLQARNGRGGDFGKQLNQVKLLVERSTGSNLWQKVAAQTVDLSNLRRIARIPLKCSEVGIQQYRVQVEPLQGELSTLNNIRSFSVNVEKKSIRVLYFAENLGQEFKILRNELAHDPGIVFTALFRTSANRYLMQGDTQPGDKPLTDGFPQDVDGLTPFDVVVLGSFPSADFLPKQMEALVQYCEKGGAVIFMGGEDSFGRGGYANTPLAPLFPWHLSNNEPEPIHGLFPLGVPALGAGSPILGGIEEIASRDSLSVDFINLVNDLKPGAIPLLSTRLSGRELAIVATQSFGKGRVLAIASSTLWKWAMRPNPIQPSYGLLWRQAVRNLSLKSEGGQHLAIHWDKDFYRPGENVSAQIQTLSLDASTLHFNATLEAKDQTNPIAVEPIPGQNGMFTVKFRFRDRDKYQFRMTVYQGSQLLETYEKEFQVASRLPEGSHLEIDLQYLKKLAEMGGGAYLKETEASGLRDLIAGKNPPKTVIQETPLIESGPWFLLIFIAILVWEWILRRNRNLV